MNRGVKINKTVKKYLRKFVVFKSKAFILVYYYFYIYNKTKKNIMNNYFNNKKEKKEEKDKWIIWRKNKRMQSPYIYFNRGDIIAITLWIKRYKFRFEGICLGYKK